MAWLGLSIADRQHFLCKVGPVVEEAVSAAIKADQCETAIEWMDQGHSIIWGQLLQLHTPVDDLRQCHPDIAVRLSTSPGYPWLTTGIPVGFPTGMKFTSLSYW
jgi:hypothetical protein